MSPTRVQDWSLFDLEVPPAGKIEYPFHVGVWEAPDPTPLAMDVHQGLEVGFVIEGHMERHFEDLVFIAGPGDVHLCSAWEPHGWRVSEPNTVSVVFIFLPEVMDNELMRGVPWLSFFTSPPRDRPRTRSPQMRRSLLDLSHLMRQEDRDRRKGWMAAMRALFFQLILVVDRHWDRPASITEHAGASTTAFSRVLPAVFLVHNDPGRDIKLGAAAAACRLRRSRFSTIFQQTMGVTFGQFRRRARLARVAHLLLSSELPVEAIADRTGFVDSSHLHRTFVRYYGRTPGEYRSLHRG
ncbi:MAG: helix-turn-helix domain-containing protein [Armatimonadota bacterium]